MINVNSGLFAAFSSASYASNTDSSILRPLHVYRRQQTVAGFSISC